MEAARPRPPLGLGGRRRWLSLFPLGRWDDGAGEGFARLIPRAGQIQNPRQRRTPQLVAPRDRRQQVILARGGCDLVLRPEEKVVPSRRGCDFFDLPQKNGN